jgi:hypothetical protein
VRVLAQQTSAQASTGLSRRPSSRAPRTAPSKLKSSAASVRSMEPYAAEMADAVDELEAEVLPDEVDAAGEGA